MHLEHEFAPDCRLSPIILPVGWRSAARIPHVSPSRRRACVDHVQQKLYVS